MTQNPFHSGLYWNSYDNYWLCVVPTEGGNLDLLNKELKDNGYSTFIEDGYFALYAPRDWADSWYAISESIKKHNFINPKISLIGSNDERPTRTEIMETLQSVEKTDLIASNLWLGEAIMNDRIECHFQPIIDRSGQPFGYESFARLRLENGETVSGGKIIQAARDLNIDHLVDKYLQILAIQSFAEGGLPGNLFINFNCGFIQLPSKYLEGLTEAAKQYNIMARRIVLDVSDVENVRDLDQVASVINFCNSKGYSVALDDVNSLASLKNILQKIHAKPDFIKLDRTIINQCRNSQIFREIWSLTELAHEKGSMILAEGIETEECYKLLQNSAIDLFQGYYIAQPMPVSEIKRDKKAAV